MGTTYRTVVLAIKEELKKNLVNSDISDDLVFYWVLVLANQLRSQNIKKRKTGAYLEVFQSVPVTTLKTTTNPNQIAGRKFITIPALVYDMTNDEGIDSINYNLIGNRGFERVPFQRIKYSEAYRLQFSPYETPSPTNPYWYRLKGNIYFVGIDDITVKDVEIGLYTALDTKVSAIDIDSVIDISEEQIILIQYQALQFGRFMMSIPKDNKIDGIDSTMMPEQKKYIATQKQEQQQYEEQ